MSKLNMSSEAMVAVSARWIDPARDRRVLETAMVTRALLPALDEVHHALLQQVTQASRRIQRVRAAADRQRALLCERRRTVVERHLHLHGEIVGHVTARAACSGEDIGLAAGYRALAERLALRGQHQTRIDDTVSALMQRLSARDEVLAVLIRQWLDAAAEKKQLDRRRTRLGKNSPVSATSSSPSSDAARRAWCRVAETLHEALARANGDGSPQAGSRVSVGANAFQSAEARREAACERILGPLRRAESLAIRRSGQQMAAASPTVLVNANAAEASGCDRTGPTVVPARVSARLGGSGSHTMRSAASVQTWPV